MVLVLLRARDKMPGSFVAWSARVCGLLLAVFVLSGCMSVYYAPKAGPVLFFPPEKLEREPQNLWVENSKGERLHAWWFGARFGPSRGTMVHFHGNAENLTSHYLMMLWVTDAGYDYLIFDYPGYGLSEGETTAAGTVEAGALFLREVHARIDPRPLIVYGQSLGGIVAQRAVLEVKGEVPLCDVILDSTFRSYRTMARRKLGQFWFTWLLQPLGWLLTSDAAAPGDLKGISPVPTLVIHGEKDFVVGPENGRDILAELAEPKESWWISDGVHGGTFRVPDQRYRELLMNRLKTTCPARF